MGKCNKRQTVYYSWVCLVTLAALLNLVVCGYLLFVIDVRGIQDSISKGFTLADNFFTNFQSILHVANAMGELQTVAYSLNTSLGILKEQLGNYLPKIDLALQRTFALLERLNGTAGSLETSIGRLAILPGAN